MASADAGRGKSHGLGKAKSSITSDAELLPHRERDDAVGLYVEASQPIVNHGQGLSRLLGQPRARYDVIGSAPLALDQHLAIDHQPFGSGRLRPARQRNRSACAANKVFVITPNRHFGGMARAQIDDRCRRMGSADRQEPCPRSRHGRVRSGKSDTTRLEPQCRGHGSGTSDIGPSLPEPTTTVRDAAMLRPIEESADAVETKLSDRTRRARPR